MNGVFRLFAILALAGAPFAAFAAAPGDVRTPSAAAVSGAPMTAKERADATKAFVSKWGAYVKRVYGVDAAVWAGRMSSVFAAADDTNLREALKRDTFDGAMAEINGAGNTLTDKQAMELLSKAQQSRGGPAQPNTLGALSNDLVYTPLQPCRILDTRNTAAGRLAANSTRDFLAINASSFTSQGGSSTNCGTIGLSATAVAVNVTAVGPTYVGYTTVYPYGTTRPVVASITYSAGANVNNAMIAQIPNPLSSSDFTIFTSAPAHYVADIVGYFAPPVATALQCLTTAATIDSVPAGGTKNTVAPACPTGYTETATQCEAQTWAMPFVFIKDGVCSAQNNSTGAAELRASRKCCRVPGR